jgi:hypothetical protein
MQILRVRLSLRSKPEWWVLASTLFRLPDKSGLVERDVVFSVDRRWRVRAFVPTIDGWHGS